jgi:hypothetical protein
VRGYHLRGAMWFPWDDYSCSGCNLIIIGNWSHLESGISCEALMFLPWRVVSFPHGNDVISQSCPSQNPGDCRWETQIKGGRCKMKAGMLNFYPAFG